MAKECFGAYDGITVESYDTLLVDFAVKDAPNIIEGFAR